MVYKAIVIGAGPAGITTVANLLSNNMKSILWIDPEFNVGRLSRYYNVPSNTKNKFFINYFGESEILKAKKAELTKYWDKINPEDTSRLLLIVNSLKDTTQFLLWSPDVEKLKETVQKIELKDGIYHINEKHKGEYVFLCTGSHPIVLDIHDPKTQQVVDFDLLMNDDYIDVEKNDLFGIVGSSHSAMLGIMNLSKYTKNIINFYRTEIKYAIFYPDWTLYDNTGLKGDVAEWTKKNINSLKRVDVSDPKFKEIFAKCNKIGYAVGFAKNRLPEIIINGRKMDTNKLQYNESTGEIQEKMYGFGLAFPKKVIDKLGNIEYAVGVWKFMLHTAEVIRNLALEEKITKGERKNFQGLIAENIGYLRQSKL